MKTKKSKLPTAIFSVGGEPLDPNSWHDPLCGNWYVKQSVQPFPPGTYRVRAKHNAFWGEGKDYVSRPLVNPTWKTLLMQLRRAMACTGDTHHCFLEGAGVVNENGTQYIELWTGS